MHKKLFFISLVFICCLLIFTSIIKNKTRSLEKDISKINNEIFILEKQIKEAKTDFVYLSSPEKLKSYINKIKKNEYINYEYSRIFFSINHFLKTNSKNLN